MKPYLLCWISNVIAATGTGRGAALVKSVFMHFPMGSFGGWLINPIVEIQGLSEPDDLSVQSDGLVTSSCLPETMGRESTGPCPLPVFSLSFSKEMPLVLPLTFVATVVFF